MEPQYKIIVEIQPHDGFRDVITCIQNLALEEPSFVEEVSEIWNFIFWNLIFVQEVRYFESIKSRSDDLDKLSGWVTALGTRGLSARVTLSRITDTLLKPTKGNTKHVVRDLVEGISYDGLTFVDIRDVATSLMDKGKARGVVLLDSLENFRLENPTMGKAIAGLLKCQGEFHTPASPCDIRCCIPAELYFNFRSLSENENKDFKRELEIHWKPAELLQIAAMRHRKYLEYNHPEEVHHVSEFNLDERHDVARYWRTVLPNRVKNRLGLEEEPIQYILRHTQLLPRQLLMLLNQICIINVDLRKHPTDICEEAIVRGISDREDTICHEILKAFEFRHPDAEIACQKCIKYLPFYFGEGELRKVFHSQWEPYVLSGRSEASPMVAFEKLGDFERLQRMLLEIGAIGIVEEPVRRKIAEENERREDEIEQYRNRGESAPEWVRSPYIDTQFEYTVSRALNPSSHDRFCIHPLFIEAFNAIKPKKTETIRVVHPAAPEL